MFSDSNETRYFHLHLYSGQVTVKHKGEIVFSSDNDYLFEMKI
jgi:hypothetical protein